MKIRKSKFIVGSLLSVLSVGVVGSVASTYAWYTYNTRASIAYEGITAGNTENLQVKLSSETSTDAWRTSLSSAEITADSIARKHAGATLSPVTALRDYGDEFIGIKKEGTLGDSYFFGSPTANDSKIGDLGLKDTSGNYNFFQTKFDIRCIDPNDSTKGYEQDIWCTYLKLTMTTAEGDMDVTDAVRVHFQAGTEGHLVAPGVAADGELNLFGALDLDNDGVLDHGYKQLDSTYHWPNAIPGITEDTETNPIIYGTNGAKEQYYGTNTFVATFENGRRKSGGVSICKTNENRNPVEVTMTIFLDGWASQMIDENAKATFSLAMVLQCDVL